LWRVASAIVNGYARTSSDVGTAGGWSEKTVPQTEITLFPFLGLFSAAAWLQYDQDWQAGLSGPIVASQ
jgi:hypothetical protein